MITADRINLIIAEIIEAIKNVIIITIMVKDKIEVIIIKPIGTQIDPETIIIKEIDLDQEIGIIFHLEKIIDNREIREAVEDTITIDTKILTEIRIIIRIFQDQDQDPEIVLRGKVANQMANLGVAIRNPVINKVLRSCIYNYLLEKSS